MTSRDPRFERELAHPLARAFQDPRGGPMVPSVGQGLPPGLLPMRAPGQGLGPGYEPQVPPVGVMVPGQTAPDQLLRVRGFDAIDQDNEGAARSIEFPDDGWVTAMIGVARANGTEAGQASLQFRATVGDEIGQFVTNGLDATWATFQMFGGDEWEWQPIARPVSKLERWNFTCRNVGESQVTPDLTLKFRALRSPGMYGAPLIGGEDPEVFRVAAPLVLAETAPNRIVRVEGLTAIGASLQGNVRTVQFPEDGYVTHVLAQAPYLAEGEGTYAPYRTSIGLQLQFGDTGGFFTTDGQAADFSLLSCWGNRRARWMPFFRAVQRDVRYSVSAFNFGLATLPAPEVLFKFRSARSLSGRRYG